MPRYAFTLQLKDDSAVIERYKEYHRNVFPEVIEALKAVGVIRMDIYLLGRRLFMAMETVEDFDLDGWGEKYLAHHPCCREWDALMRTFQEPVPEARDGEWWAGMDRVFEF